MSDNVASPFEWAAIDWCSKRIVHDEGHSMLMRHLGKSFDVKHIAARVAYGLSEEAIRIMTELLLYPFIIPFRVNKGALNTEFLHRHAKEVERAAIDSVASDEVVACLADIEYCIEVGSLSA